MLLDIDKSVVEFESCHEGMEKADSSIADYIVVVLFG